MDDCQKVVTYVDGNGTRIEYSRSKNSVTRSVHLARHRQISSRIQIKTDLDGEDAQSAFEYAFLRKRSFPMQFRGRRVVRGADLFCSCGGMSLGAMEACRALGKVFFPTVAIDVDPVPLRVYESNFNCGRTLPVKIETILNGKIGSKATFTECLLLKMAGKVDILLAGPPCQGYSDLNNHTRRNDPKNTLYEKVARFAEIAKPKHVLVENVPAAIHGVERSVERSISLMEDIGYEVDDDVVDLAEIGVPQRRKRLVLVASLSKKPSIKKIVEKNRVKHVRSVKWAIEDLLDEDGDGVFDEPSRQSEENMQRIRYLYENNLYDLPDPMRPQCHKKGGHSYKSMYGRLKIDEPAQTITSGFGSPGQGRFIHPTRMRMLTPHEAARLQSFPDFFDFSSVKSRVSLASMIGNAVPMKLSYVICLELLR